MTLSVFRLYSIDERMINEGGAVDRMISSRGETTENLTQYLSVLHKSHIT
jgi:hypothetical protein